MAALGSTSGAERGVSVHFHNQPLAVAAGILNDFVHPSELALDDNLVSDATIWVHLHQASTSSMLQALAHASDAWWWHNAPQQRYHLQQSPTPIDPNGVRVRSYATSLTQRYDLEEGITTLMQPWLEYGDHGIAHVPWTGQWTASTTSMGHAQLRTLLSLMEGSDTIVPMPTPSHDQPQHQTTIEQWDNPHTAWLPMLMDLAQEWSISVAVSPGAAAMLRQLSPPQQIDHLEDLQAHLQERYLTARWVSGVLCIDRSPPQRRHAPIVRRHFAMIPIAHMSERYDGHLVASALRRSTSSIDWQQFGRACLFIDNPPRLLIAIEGEKINRILDHLDYLETNGSLILTE
ncbi:MAG: hypothetical protein EA401_03720 [Planctomycetota bacterium]|nr:MAG: hypothetical protein EA401_03720 [Planctomycetota bacterium]